MRLVAGRCVVVVAVAVIALAGGGGVAAGGYPPPTVTVVPPDTSDCGQRVSPEPAIDTSEDVPPGEDGPAPLPVPASPVGGALLGGCGFVLPPGAAALPSDISAQAWLVADLTTGQVLGGKDPHGRYRPASTLKLLTMLVLVPTLTDLDQTVIGTTADANQEGSRVGIGPGGVYTVRDLFLGLMLNSGNDAAFALATAYGGFDVTVAAMNTTAGAIGALDTRAATVSGLDGPGQQTSAYDLALIMRADLALPAFVGLNAAASATFPGYGSHPAFGIANENKLLANYPGAVAGKTGFTNDARNTYVGVADRNGHRLVVTMLGGTQNPRRQWMQAASLLDWGFAAAAAGVAPVGRLVDPAADASSSPAAAAGSSAGGAGTAGAGTSGAAATAGASTFAGVATATSTSGAGSAGVSTTATGAPGADNASGRGSGWAVAILVAMAAAGLSTAIWRRRRARPPSVGAGSRGSPVSDPTSPDKEPVENEVDDPAVH